MKKKSNRPSKLSSPSKAMMEHKPWMVVFALIIIFALAWQYSKTSISASEAGLDTKTLFVSTDGKDINPGTFSSPLRSIAKAVSFAQPGQRLKVSIIGPTFNPNTSDDGRTTTIDEGETVAIMSENNPTTITPDKSNPRYNYLHFLNYGNLKITNLAFLDANFGVENQGVFDMSKNIIRSSMLHNTGGQVHIMCASPNCVVSNNQFFLPPVPKVADVQGVGLSGITPRSNAKLTISNNTFFFPSIANNWPVHFRYKGIQLAQAPDNQGSVYVSRNIFRTEQYNGLKDYIGEVGIYLSGSSVGYKAGINNFSNFSGINFIYDEVWEY